MANRTFTISVYGEASNQPPHAGRPFRGTLSAAAQYLRAVAARGRKAVSARIMSNGVAATGTITLASIGAGHVIEINGVRFTAIAATGVVAHNTFAQTGTDTADATALAAAINACTDLRIKGVVTATSALGVVTLTAVEAGRSSTPAIRIRNLGILASAVVTPTSAQSGDTVTLNGVALTATQHHATGTVTCASVLDGDTVTVQGIVFTAEDGVADVDSFDMSSTDTDTGDDLVRCINGHPSLAGIVTATAALGVVTVRAVSAGTGGNALTLASSNGTRLAVSGATLAGGVAVGANEFDFTGGDTVCAADLVRCITASASALISGHFTARSTGAAVTVVATNPGQLGNCCTIDTSNETRLPITGSVSRLAGATVAALGGTAAGGTITIGAGSGNYTAKINGVATGNVAWDTNSTLTAAALASAIANLAGLVESTVRVSASSGVITVTALEGGVAGNAITLACTGTNATASGARLTGGAAPTVLVTTDGTGGSGDEASALTFG
jgi:hypothetical protein